MPSWFPQRFVPRGRLLAGTLLGRGVKPSLTAPGILNGGRGLKKLPSANDPFSPSGLLQYLHAVKAVSVRLVARVAAAATVLKHIEQYGPKATS